MPYGDEQAHYTLNRAAYGDFPAAMMGGSSVYAPAPMNPMSAIGQYVMPASYYAPPRVHMGYYGMYQQHTGMMRGLANMVGLTSVPRGTTALEYSIYSAGDMGERVGGGMAGGAIAAGAMGAGFAMEGAMSAAGAFAGGAIGSAVAGPASPIGGAVGGFLGGVAGGFAAFGVSSMAGAAVSGAIQARRNIENFLESSSFRFVGAGGGMSDPRFGGGMSRSARRETAEFIRSEDIKDPYMDTKDLTQILKQGTNLGLFAGTRDMSEFQQSFKDITGAVKNVTRFLHQTLEEGLKTIKDLKGIGVDPSQVKGMVMMADATGRSAGRTGMEMISLGLQGAEMFRGTGVNMGMGAQATMMNLSSIRAARDAGTLSQEVIAQAGGEEALAMRQTAGGLAFGQSAMGRGFMASLYNPMTGGMGNVGGGGGFLSMVTGAAQNISSPAGVIGFQAHQADLMSQMQQQYGGQGLQVAQLQAFSKYGRYMAGVTGASTEDATRALMLQNGVSQPEVDAMFGQVKGRQAIYNSAQASAEATRQKQQVEEASQNFIGNRLIAHAKDLGKSVIDVAARPLNALYDSTAEAFMNFRDKHVLGITRVNNNDLAFSGVSTPGSQGPTDLDDGAWFTKSAGRQLYDTLKAGPNTGVHTRRIRKDQMGKDDINLMNEVSLGGADVGTRYVNVISRQEAASLAATRASDPMSGAEAAAMDKAGKLRGTKALNIFSVDSSAIHDFKSAAVAFYGTKAVEHGLTDAQRARVSQAMHEGGLDDMLNKDVLSREIEKHGLTNSKLKDASDVSRKLDSVVSRIADQTTSHSWFGKSDPGLDRHALELVAKAQMSATPAERAKYLAEAKSYAKGTQGIDVRRAQGLISQTLNEHGADLQEIAQLSDNSSKLPSKGVAGAQGASVGGGPSAEGTFKQQTAINEQILAVMTSLAARLHVQ